MKQLSSFLVVYVGGGERVSYTYDEIDDESGEVANSNNKASFFAVDEGLRAHVEAIRDYICENKLAG